MHRTYILKAENSDDIRIEEELNKWVDKQFIDEMSQCNQELKVL